MKKGFDQKSVNIISTNKMEICPRCGGELRLKRTKFGTTLHYVCEDYPDCKFSKKFPKSDGFDELFGEHEESINY